MALILVPLLFRLNVTLPISSKNSGIQKSEIHIQARSRILKKQNLNYKQDTRMCKVQILAAKESKIHIYNLL